MQVILVEKTTRGYRASLETDPLRVAGEGSTPSEAVGDLIIYYPDTTQILVKKAK